MTMNAIKKGSHWISGGIQQGATESDWVEQQPIIEGVLGSVTKIEGTNSNQLVCYDEDISDGERFVIRQAGDVFEGVANVVSSTQVETSRIDGFRNTNYDGKTHDFTAQDGFVVSLRFNENASKLFVLGRENNKVYQYSLSSPGIISTTSVSYDNVSFGILEDTQPEDMSFSIDGTKMYVVGQSSGSIYQYTLSTAWDIGTASYDSVSFSVTPQESTPRAISFKFAGTGIGTKMYVGGGTNGVYQYTLSTPWDISTASYDGVSFNFGLDDVAGLYISYDDMYIMSDIIGADVYKYSLQTSWDVSTATGSVSFSSGYTSTHGLHLGFDNQNNFCVYITYGSNIYQYGVPSDTVINKQENTIDISDFGLASSPDYVFTQLPEVRVCLEDTNADRCLSRDTPMPIYSTGANQIQVLSLQDTQLASGDVVITNDGEVTATSVVNSGTSNTPPSYDAKNTSVRQNSSAMVFGNNGTKLYVAAAGDMTLYEAVFQYTLLTAWDISTASYDSVAFSIYTNDTSITALRFSSDGTNMYEIHGGGLYQYTLTTPWDISTAKYDYVRKNVDSANTNFHFNNDGSKLYFTWIEQSTITEHSLTTPWDISTAQQVGVNILDVGILSGEIYFNNPSSLVISSDGMVMNVIEQRISSPNVVQQYRLSSPWNIQDFFSYLDNPFAPSESSDMIDCAFNDDGTKMYLLSNADIIYQYTLDHSHSMGNEDIWNIDIPITITPTYAYIKDRSDLMPYPRTAVVGSVEDVGVSVATSGSINYTFSSQEFQITPKRAIQLSVIAGRGTVVGALKANLWKSG